MPTRIRYSIFLVLCFGVLSCANPPNTSPHAKFKATHVRSDSAQLRSSKTEARNLSANPSSIAQTNTEPAKLILVEGKVTSLAQALDRAIEHNPSLKSSLHRVLAADALVEQAALLPNPELETEIENWGGDLDGFKESETTIAVKQPILLGGKRSAQTQLAKTQKEITELQRELLARSLQKETQVAYYRLVSREAIVQILERQVVLSKRVLSLIRTKLSAGAVLAVEQTKAEIELKNDTLALAVAESERAVARESLASLWGGTGNDIGEVGVPLSPSATKGYLRQFSPSDTPSVRLAVLRKQAAKSRLNVERTLGIPDASVGFGYKRLEESESNAFLGLVSIDLPVFNRNQGAVKGATEDFQAAELDKQSLIIRTRALLQNLQTSLRVSLLQLEGIRTTLLPKAEQAFKEAEEAYNRGRSSYLELLDAQRTLIETKKREQEVLLSISERQAQIQELVGEAISFIKGGNNHAIS